MTAASPKTYVGMAVNYQDEVRIIADLLFVQIYSRTLVVPFRYFFAWNLSEVFI